MKALITMWRSPRMIVMTAVVAAIYASSEIVLTPFAIVLIPGVLIFRLSNVFTMFFALLFGPAGAFGVGFGNVIGDYFTGGLALGSFFGFLSTFAIGYVGYTFWMRLRDPSSSKFRQVVVYLITGVVAAVVSGVVLGWGLQLLGLAPFGFTSNLLFVNFVIGNWIGGIFYSLVYERLKLLGLTWTDIMEQTDIGEPKFALPGALLMTIGSFGAWICGAFLREGMIIVDAFCALILLGSLLL
jgi:energy-coupling factor transport system substrate-specific component